MTGVMPMEVMNAIRLVVPAPDSQYRLVPCDCGNDQPVYVMGCDGAWRAAYLDCGYETEEFPCKHYAQEAWNRRTV